MKVERLEIADVILVTPPRYGDARGFFSETFNAVRFTEAGIQGPFVQDNQSLSRQKGVVRGLHCQLPPFAQGKLVRFLRGAIWAGAVDARTGRPTYGRWVAAEITAENGTQIWVPPGFLHGFCTTQPDTEVSYKVTAPYDKASERGVMWNDPALALPWPIEAGEAVLSDKDVVLPGFEAAQGWFSA